jgi:sugar (pentulose or hexulose) kinase
MTARPGINRGANLAIGLDIGTSGCRAVAINARRQRLGTAEVALPTATRGNGGKVEQDPERWWDATLTVLRRLVAVIDRDLGGNHHSANAEPLGNQLAGNQLAGNEPLGNDWTGKIGNCALCVDATSATLLLCGSDGTPLSPALMYNDSRSRAAAQRIDALAPGTSAARGAGSSLAKALHLSAGSSAIAMPDSSLLPLHQADWIIGRLRGHFGDTDWNNALKLGFDTACNAWPDWVRRLLPPTLVLPRVHAPGRVLGTIAPSISSLTGLPAQLMLCAGTTDSTAAVIATGACGGDAVTSLGSTLVLKLVAERPVSAPHFGVYSHRFGDHWLVGGASNSGGAVLRQHFTDARLAELSRRIDPSLDSGLDYYPLPGVGERFPIADPSMVPRLSPRPTDDARFLHALLEGIARIERDGYERLVQLGATPPDRVLTTGGGARNPVWTALRQRLLDVPVRTAEHQDAAYGAALLALSALPVDQTI